jgi:predicted anti-sigma-YlaC factor YlaD
MDCRKVQSAILRYVCGETTDKELRVIREQLELCEDCRDELEVISGMLRLAGSSAATEPIPEGARDRILGKLHTKVKG